MFKPVLVGVSVCVWNERTPLMVGLLRLSLDIQPWVMVMPFSSGERAESSWWKGPAPHCINGEPEVQRWGHTCKEWDLWALVQWSFYHWDACLSGRTLDLDLHPEAVGLVSTGCWRATGWGPVKQGGRRVFLVSSLYSIHTSMLWFWNVPAILQQGLCIFCFIFTESSVRPPPFCSAISFLFFRPWLKYHFSQGNLFLPDLNSSVNIFEPRIDVSYFSRGHWWRKQIGACIILPLKWRWSIHTHTETYTLRHTARHTYTDIHRDTHTHTYTHWHTDIHTYTDIYIHMYTQTHTHTHIQTMERSETGTGCWMPGDEELQAVCSEDDSLRGYISA